MNLETETKRLEGKWLLFSSSFNKWNLYKGNPQQRRNYAVRYHIPKATIEMLGRKRMLRRIRPGLIEIIFPKKFHNHN